MLRYQITVPQWLEIPSEVKVKMISIFKIPKSDGCSIHGNRIVSDGHTHSDLAVVTTQKMQEFLESTEEDFWKLLHLTEEKIEKDLEKEKKLALEQTEKTEEQEVDAKAEALGELAKKMEEIANGAKEVLTKRRGRPKKV